MRRPSSLSLGYDMGCPEGTAPGAVWPGAGSRTSLSPSPLLLPGVWDTADDGAEHEGCDKGEESQVDEALDTIIAEACEGLHVVLRAGGDGDGDTDTERETGKHKVRWSAHREPPAACTAPDWRLGRGPATAPPPPTLLLAAPRACPATGRL